MVNKRDDFTPVVAIPPGETLKENLDYINMSQKELSERTGISIKHINEIIKGKSPITQETALKLEYVLGIPANFWNNLEANYRDTLARIKDEDELETEFDIAKEIPYSVIAKLGWVNPTKDIKEKVKNLRSYFGVSSLKQVPLVFSGAFRKVDSKNTSSYALAAWLRKGLLISNSIQTETFNRSKLKKLIPTFRELTNKDPKEFYPEMNNLCASCGIALVLVEHIPKTYACGATQWVNANKAIIQLSVRGAKADIFWFTFFHELAHILLHENKEFHLQEFQKDCASEDEADNYASNWLIPIDEYKKFLKTDYRDKNNIKLFAQKINIHPCIVVGRLCHDNKTEFKYYNDLRPSFIIVHRNN